MHKRLWTKINQIRNPGKPKIPPQNAGGLVVTGGQQKSDLFVGILEDVFRDGEDVNFNESFKEATEEEVRVRMKKIDAGKAGADGGNMAPPLFSIDQV